MTWTQDREIRLAYLWVETEMSAAQIAEEMGGFEHCRDRGRNSVMGKVMRLGLPLRKTKKTPEQIAQERIERDARKRETDRIRREAERVERERERVAEAIAEMLASEKVAEEQAARALSFDEIRPFSQRHSNQCRFIVNDDPSNYLYCAAVTAPGDSWCPSCKDIVYAKPQPVLSDAERFRRRMAFKKNALSQGLTSMSSPTDEAA